MLYNIQLTNTPNNTYTQKNLKDAIEIVEDAIHKNNYKILDNHPEFQNWIASQLSALVSLNLY